MPELDYHLLDVFTDRPFAGNQLAVFVDPPADLDDAVMQSIARELQLSETVFCSSPADGAGSWPTRIFTPGEELPFAGHPTIGTAVLLAHLGRVDGGVVTLAEGAGDVPVIVSSGPGSSGPGSSGPGSSGTASRQSASAGEAGVGHARFTAPQLPEPVETVDPGDLARAVGLEISDLHREIRAGGWSAGVPFAIIPVRSVADVERAEVDLAWWRDEVAYRGADQLYVAAPVDGTPDSAEWRVRMFAPGFGIPEDPATGSAAAAFAGMLVGRASEQRLAGGWVLHQGVEMGRPSRLEVGVTVEGGELRAVHVGGDAVVVGHGTLVV